MTLFKKGEGRKMSLHIVQTITQFSPGLQHAIGIMDDSKVLVHVCIKLRQIYNGEAVNSKKQALKTDANS